MIFWVCQRNETRYNDAVISRHVFSLLQFGLALAICAPSALFAAEPPPEWLLKNGESYFGTPVSYDFDSKEVVIRKGDGKMFNFSAGSLAHDSKLQLIGSPVFKTALKGYSMPFGPTFVLVIGLFLAVSLPTIIGLWGSAHVLGAIASGPKHLIGFGKLLVVIVLQFGIWLTLSWVLDPDLPIVPDKKRGRCVARFDHGRGIARCFDRCELPLRP